MGIESATIAKDYKLVRLTNTNIQSTALLYTYSPLILGTLSF